MTPPSLRHLHIRGRYRLWRQAVGYLAVYALVLNAFLAGILTSQLASTVASDAAGFELCLTGDPSHGPGNVPPADHGTCQHCALCGLAGAKPLPPTASFAVAAIQDESEGLAFGPRSDPAPISPAIDLSKPPRGPPLEA